MADEPKPEDKKVEPKFSVEKPPVGKEQWDELRNADPELWGELTQANADRLFKQNKTLETERDNLKAQNVNLQAQNKTLQVPKFNLKKPEVGEETSETYSVDNMPQTKQEWEDLSIDDNVLFTDLRNHYISSQKQQGENFDESRLKSKKVVWEEHPDMYLPELNEDGSTKKDDKGKVILLRDVNGEAVLDDTTDKGKLFLEIYNEDKNIGLHSDAPELIMGKLERRLKQKGVKVVEDAKGKEQEKKETQVVQDGVKPPEGAAGVYKSEQEKTHAQASIKRGTFASEEDYFKSRDSKEEGIYDENSVPIFGK